MAAREEEQKALQAQAALLQKQKEVADLQKTTADAQKAAADAEKAAVEAQKAAMEAAFPKGEAEPLAGEITADSDKFGYVAELVAYHTLKESAEAIGRAINDLSLSPGPAKILIVGERTVAQDDLPWIQLDKQFTVFDAMLEARIEHNESLLGEREAVLPAEPAISELEGLPPGGELEAFPIAALTPALMALPSVASSVADIAGYFRVNYSIKGQDFELGSDALIAVVAGQISSHQVHILNFHLINDSATVDRLTNLVTERQKLEKAKELLASQIVAPATGEIATLTSRVTTLEADLAKLDQGQQAEQAKALEAEIAEHKDRLAVKQGLLDKAKAAIVESESVGKAFGDFVTALTSTPDDKTPPLLVQAALRQQIREQGITHLLHLKVLSSGGEAITKKRLFGSGETAYIGGSAISYVLATVAGHVVSADAQVALAQLDYNLSAPGAVNLRKIRFMNRDGRVQEPVTL